MRDPQVGWPLCEWSTCVWGGALWMGEVRLVDARGMPMCMKRKGALPEVEGSVTKCRHYRWVCALTATLWSLAHWYGSQSACLVPCRPRFKSMWGDHALPSLQTGHILSHWILLEFWNVHNVEDARYWAVIFEVLLRTSWNFRKIWVIEYVLICSWNFLINMYT